MAWPVTASRIAYENPWITVREDQVVRPDGSPGIYGVVELRDAVFVVALDDDDRVVLVALDRHTVGESLEIPAGGGDGEDPLIAAQRELREETGLSAASWEPLGSFTSLNGCARARDHAFLARGLSADADASEHQHEEGIAGVRRIPFADVWALIADGTIDDGETIAALTLAAIRLGASPAGPASSAA